MHACGFYFGGGATCTWQLVHSPSVSLSDASALVYLPLMSSCHSNTCMYICLWNYKAKVYPQRRPWVLQEQFWFARVIHNRLWQYSIYVLMCMSLYVYMRKFSTCSFSMQLCNSTLCASQLVKHATLYSSSAKNCSLCFHVCDLCMLWWLLIADHNTPFCLSNGRIPVSPWGATSSPHALLN